MYVDAAYQISNFTLKFNIKLSISFFKSLVEVRIKIEFNETEKIEFPVVCN